ncbi:MAG: CHAP domain-containing protein [Lachnospiraceae bacterium]|nr:CHAP domain-containing protein [Lachnospiraceae bacterium]
MNFRRVNRKMMYVLSFMACILLVNVGGLIVSHADENDVIIKYRTYTNNSGWQDDAEQGGDCAVDSKEVITGMKMMVVMSEDVTIDGTVKYSVYSKESNWSQEVDTFSKASSGDNAIKAIKAELTGTLASQYDIEYRACTSDNQWLSWSKNGVVVGNIDGEANIIAIQAKINKKVEEPVTLPETGTTPDSGAVILPETGTTPDSGVVTLPETGTTPDSGVVTLPETGTPEVAPGTSGNEAMEAFVNKAVSQKGQTRNAEGNTVYGEWWAARVGNSAFKDAKWCAMFLSWCANEAGISEKTVGYFAACSHWQEFYQNNGRWHAKDGYTPKRGDIIFFDYDGDGSANHNGVVESVSGSKVTALEGNVNDYVDRVEYELTNNTIIGYGDPDYANNAANVEADKQQQQQQEETGASGQAQRILEVAENEIGTRERSDGWTKYGQWYNDNIDNGGFAKQAWCAMFVSWCADQTGVSRDVIKPYASCWYGLKDLKTRGEYHEASSGYQPKPGDIFFHQFKSNGSGHTGLVEKIQDAQICTIEGNTSNSVDRRTYPLSTSKMKGYITPKYN